MNATTTSTCTQTLTVIDDTPPVITCPADATVDCKDPSALNGVATATDDCHEVVITHSDGPMTGLCPETFVRTWTATDECDNYLYLHADHDGNRRYPTRDYMSSRCDSRL